MKSLNFIVLFIIFTIFAGCKENNNDQYPKLLIGHWFTKDIGNRIDLIFVDGKKVVVIIEAANISLDRKYKLLNNNTSLRIEGFKNNHIIKSVDEETLIINSDNTEKAKRPSPLANHTYYKIIE